LLYAMAMDGYGYAKSETAACARRWQGCARLSFLG
jgi:hypothetical protein